MCVLARASAAQPGTQPQPAGRACPRHTHSCNPAYQCTCTPGSSSASLRRGAPCLRPRWSTTAASPPPELQLQGREGCNGDAGGGGRRTGPGDTHTHTNTRPHRSSATRTTGRRALHWGRRVQARAASVGRLQAGVDGMHVQGGPSRPATPAVQGCVSCPVKLQWHCKQRTTSRGRPPLLRCAVLWPSLELTCRPAAPQAPSRCSSWRCCCCTSRPPAHLLDRARDSRVAEVGVDLGHEVAAWNPPPRNHQSGTHAERNRGAAARHHATAHDTAGAGEGARAQRGARRQGEGSWTAALVCLLLVCLLLGSVRVWASAVKRACVKRLERCPTESRALSGVHLGGRGCRRRHSGAATCVGGCGADAVLPPG